MMGRVWTFLILIVQCLSQQTCSISNYVTFTSEREPSATNLDPLDRSAEKTSNRTVINLSQSLHEYCNDYRNIQGHEGSSRPGFTLRQVHIILTPGHTSSPVETSNHPLHIPEPSCQVLPRSEDSHKIHSFAETSAIYSVVQHNKHAFKYFHPILSPSCTDTHVTNAGFKQSIRIGEHLSERYFIIKEIKLKPHTDSIHAESITDKPSYHNLLAFLHGFLPEKIFANTRVHKTSGNFCNFDKESNISCHCRTAEYFSKPVRQSVVKGRYLFKDAYPGKDIINSVLKGISTGNLSPLELFQALTFHICDNKPVVCDRTSNCINVSSNEHVNPLHQLVSRLYQTVSHDATFQLFSQLYSFPFLHQLVTKIDTWKSVERLHIYSGDSFFLHILLSSLWVRFEGPVPMASRLIVQVYQKNQGQMNEGLPYFSILYNGYDVTDHLLFCDGQLEEGLCSVQRLTEKVMELQGIYKENC